MTAHGTNKLNEIIGVSTIRLQVLPGLMVMQPPEGVWDPARGVPFVSFCAEGRLRGLEVRETPFKGLL